MSLHNINLALKRQQSNRFMMIMDKKIRIEPLFISRKVETMLAITMTDKKHSLEINQEPRWNTYIPSPFFLLLAIENGWKIARMELVPSEDQHSLIYAVILKSESFQPDQKVVLPSNALVKKILAENSQMAVPVMAEALN